LSTLFPQSNRLTPSQLNALTRRLLEDAFPIVEVEGEVGSVKLAQSGHWYFTLKDADAEVRVVMYRSRAAYAQLKPQMGLQLAARGRMTLFEARGEYQLIAEWLMPAGVGAQLLALKRLKEKLAAEGLFASERKRRLPSRPRTIALFTSTQGAALHDVLAVLKRRYRLAAIELWPIPVQGAAAAGEIVSTLQLAFRHSQADVLLLTRGGGSKEDLSLFDDEPLARQLAAAPMPTVVAIGHEVDLSVAELVADVRAATPSAAAELIAPDGLRLAGELNAHLKQLQGSVAQMLNSRSQQCDQLALRLSARHPRRSIELKQARIKQLHMRLMARAQHDTAHARQRLARLRASLLAFEPRSQLLRRREQLPLLKLRLENAFRRRQASLQSRLQTHQRALVVQSLPLKQANLQALSERATRALKTALHRKRELLEAQRRALMLISPHATLERGYALVFAVDRVISSKAEVSPGEDLRLAFADGDVGVRVS
jgi:exodeoxyribonuclease VII large subunit